jgi:DNA-binding CsgD family transcriptional regulator
VRGDGKAPRLEPPRDLVAYRGHIEDDEYAVIEWPAPPSLDVASLTPAERDVLAHVLEGMTNGEIAARRGTARRTVANQIEAIFQKLGVRSRAELFARAADPARGAER